MPKCVLGLHRRGRIACPPFSKRGQKSTPIRWSFVAVLETLFQDGRSGLQGVSKGCQRGAPVDPNVSQGSPKRAQRVAKGAQTVPKGRPGVPKGCPKVPMVAQRVFNGWPRAPQRCPREPKGCPRYAQRPRGVKIGAQTAIIHHIRYQQMTKNITSLACLALSLSLSLSISLSL